MVIVFVDYDGTLLTETRRLSPVTLSALEMAAAADVWVIPASGRPLAGLNLHSNFEPEAAIALNGAIVRYESTSQLSEAEPISPSDVALCAALAAESDVCFNIYTAHRWLSTVPHHRLCRKEQSRTGVEPDQLLDRHILEGVHKVLLLGVSMRLQECSRLLAEAKLDQRLSWFNSDPEFLEIGRRDVTKQRGVKILTDRLQPSRTFAIGDGESDLPMFEVVDLAIAVGNAAPALFEKADLVVGANTTDGAAEAIMEIAAGRL